MSTGMDVALIRAQFTRTLAAAEILGLDETMSCAPRYAEHCRGCARPS